MKIPKEQIVEFIESRLGSQQAAQAKQQLPDHVDHEQHADLLSRLGVDPKELLSHFGGAGAAVEGLLGGSHSQAGGSSAASGGGQGTSDGSTAGQGATGGSGGQVGGAKP